LTPIEELRPSRSWAELIEHSRKRGTALKRRSLLLKVAGLTLSALVIAGVAIQLVLPGDVHRVETADQPGGIGDPQSGPEGDGSVGSEGGGPPRPEGRGGSKKSTAGGSASTGGVGGSLSSGVEAIAFTRGSDIYLMNTDGTDPRKLRAGVGPRWSPDGGRIAFGTSNISDGVLQVMNANGSDFRSLGTTGAFPSWSPDGDQLTFNWPCDAQTGRPCDSSQPELACGPECGIGVVASDGSGGRRLGTGLWPDWGPDGRIMFTDGTADEPCEYETGLGAFAGDREVRQPTCTLPIWVMNPDGSGRTKLPIDDAIKPTWSADGRRIAYYTDGGVFIANADGTGIVQVAPAKYMHPTWSSDGLWLALTRITTSYGATSIYVRGTDGSKEKALTPAPGNDWLPAFSPQR